MDSNGTRFHLLYGNQDWAPLLPESGDLYWDEAHAAVTLQPEIFRFPAPPGDQIPKVGNRQDADRDRYGNWYWLDGNEIRFLPGKRTRSEHFWDAGDLNLHCETNVGDFQAQTPPPPPPALPLSGLAVTAHHYLVVGVPAPAGLLIFDLHAGGPVRQFLWPDAVPFAPFDITATPDGGVWILDRENRRVWRLDRHLNVVSNNQQMVDLAQPTTSDFAPVEGEPHTQPGESFPTGIELEMSSPVTGAAPAAIVALPDDSYLILDSDSATGFSLVTRYRLGEPVGDPISLNDLLAEFFNEAATTERFYGYDMALVAEEAPEPGVMAATLYVVDGLGNQAFAFHLEAGFSQWTLRALPLYLPMRLFSGRSLVAARGKVYYQDLQERWLPLVAQPRPRYRRQGVLTTAPFDGKEPNCVWHRLFVDACIPAGSWIRVESRAANDLPSLMQTPWQAEPKLYLRRQGAELPAYRPFSAQEAERPGTGVWELLCQRAEGRYLQLRLAWQGSGRNSPMVRALRIYYPRFSYLKEYLPDVYQQDRPSAAFLERFLANAEGIYTVLEDQIAAVQTLFDVRTARTEYLPWLATWLGILFDPAWDERRRRLFLDHAVELFRQRGTVPGIIRTVRLALDACPDERLFSMDVMACSSRPCTRAAAYDPEAVRIVERFLTRGVAGVVFGDPVDPNEAESSPQGTPPITLVRQNAHRFTVLAPIDPHSDSAAQKRRLDLVARIVETEKPAHTLFEVRPYWAMFRVGEARLGLDTRLDVGSRFTAVLLGESYLAEAVLGAGHPWNVDDRFVVDRDRPDEKTL
jgi:phage tail-like protein